MTQGLIRTRPTIPILLTVWKVFFSPNVTYDLPFTVKQSPITIQGPP